MTIRSAFLPVFDIGRSLVTRIGGMRTTQVIIHTDTYLSGQTGVGSVTPADFDLTTMRGARPKVEDKGDDVYFISKIQPRYTTAGGGGFNVADLILAQPVGVITYLRLIFDVETVPFERQVRIHSVNARKNFEYQVLTMPRK